MLHSARPPPSGCAEEAYVWKKNKTARHRAAADIMFLPFPLDARSGLKSMMLKKISVRVAP